MDFDDSDFEDDTEDDRGSDDTTSTSSERDADVMNNALDVYRACRNAREQATGRIVPRLGPLTDASKAILDGLAVGDSERQQVHISLGAGKTGLEAALYVALFFRAGTRMMDRDASTTPLQQEVTSVLTSMPADIAGGCRALLKTIVTQKTTFSSHNIEPPIPESWSTIAQGLPTFCFETIQYVTCGCQRAGYPQPSLGEVERRCYVSLLEEYWPDQDHSFATPGDVVKHFFAQHRTKKKCESCTRQVTAQNLLVGRLPLALCVEMSIGGPEHLHELNQGLRFDYRDSNFVAHSARYGHCPATICEQGSEPNLEYFAYMMPHPESCHGYKRGSRIPARAQNRAGLEVFDEEEGSAKLEWVACAILKDPELLESS